jgi:hypothetical protein
MKSELNKPGKINLEMGNWGKLSSNLWIRISDENFQKLEQIQKDYRLNNIEEVRNLLVNENAIDCLAIKSKENANQMYDRVCQSKSPANN